MATELPFSAIRRIVKETTGSPVSEGAVTVFLNNCIEFVKTEAVKADKLAKHAGRKTIKEEDIQ